MAGCVSGHTHPKRKRRSKFNNIRTETPDGIKHASKKEAARWVFLLDQQAMGVISKLRRQTRWPLLVNNVKVGTYISDHDYWTQANQFIVEDSKSVRTAKLPLFRRNKRHMMAQYSIDVREVFDSEEPIASTSDSSARPL